MKKLTGAIILTLFIISLVAFNTGCNAGYSEDENMTGFTELENVDDSGFEELQQVSAVEEEELDTSAIEIDNEEVDIEEVAEEETEAVETPAVTQAAPAETAKKIVVTEGETVALQLRGTDPDGDVIQYTYSAPLDAEGTWTTEAGDAGTYEVDITASDGKSEVTKTIRIEVLKANEPPVIEGLQDITIEEGESVKLAPQISDPDGDKVTYTISGWMTALEKTSGYDDAGTYTVTVTATDGEFEVSKDITVVITDVNRAPEFEIVLG
jgi:hypothetical protein